MAVKRIEKYTNSIDSKFSFGWMSQDLGSQWDRTGIPLPNAIRKILRKYGATLFMPGPAEPILGPDILQGKGEFASAAGWILSPGAAVADGKLTIVSAGENQWAQPYESLLVAGKTYAYSGAATVASGSLILADHSTGVQFAGTSAINASGAFSGVFTALSSQFQIKRGGTTNVSIDNFYIREILGYQNTYSSFVAGNYRESTGQTLAAVDQQVGLVVDAAQSPGPELVANGTFDSDTAWDKGSGWTITGGKAVAAASTSRLRSLSSPIVAGKAYVVTATCTSYTSGSYKIMFEGGTNLFGDKTAAGSFSGVFTAGQSGQIYVWCNSALTAEFDNISVRELPGVHASQTTSGFQPYLRQSGGVNSWQFDGVDDRLSLSAVPFGMLDDHFVVAGGTKTGGADGDMFSIRNNTGPTQIVSVVRINAAGTLLCTYRDDANTLIQSGIAGVVPLNTPFVAALRKTGHRKSIRRDSGSWVHEDTPMGATTVNVATIGGSMSNAFGQGWPGYMHMIAIGKGAITDGEVRELEKFAAKLQGRSL